MVSETVFVTSAQGWGEGLFLAFPVGAEKMDPTMYWSDTWNRLLPATDCSVGRVREGLMARVWHVISYEEARDLLAFRSHAPARQLREFDALYDQLSSLVVGADAGR